MREFLEAFVMVFIGEMGDKTQLMAMTLAMSSSNPLLIFFATVSSMIVVSSIGIVIGKYVGKKIPKVVISYLAAALFLFFGVSKLYGALDPGFLQPVWIILFALILGIAVLYILIQNGKRRKKRDSRYLLEAYRKVKKLLHGRGGAGNCRGNRAHRRQVFRGRYSLCGEYRQACGATSWRGSGNLRRY